MADNDSLLFALSLDCLDMRVLEPNCSDTDAQLARQAARRQGEKILNGHQCYYIWADMRDERKDASSRDFFSEIERKKLSLRAKSILTKLGKKFELTNEIDQTAIYGINSLAARFFWQVDDFQLTPTPDLIIIAEKLFSKSAWPLNAEDAEGFDTNTFFATATSDWDQMLISDEMWDGNSDIFREVISLLFNASASSQTKLLSWKELLTEEEFFRVCVFLEKEIVFEIEPINSEAAKRAREMLLAM